MLLIFVHVPFQITQQLEGICLQVIGLVLQKPIIGMAGVCAQAVYCFVYTRTLSHTHTLTAFVIHYLYTDHYSNSTALCFLLSIQRFILPHNCTTNSGISVRKMRKMFLFRFIWFNQYRFFFTCLQCPSWLDEKKHCCWQNLPVFSFVFQLAVLE